MEKRADGRTSRASFGVGVVVGRTLLVLGQTLWPTAPAPPPAPAPLEDLVENRRAAAEHYQAAEKLEERFAEAVREQAKQLPTGLHELIFTQIVHNIRVDKLKRAERDLLVKYFTVQELEALAHFYETSSKLSQREPIARPPCCLTRALIRSR